MARELQLVLHTSGARRETYDISVLLHPLLHEKEPLFTTQMSNRHHVPQ